MLLGDALPPAFHVGFGQFPVFVIHEGEEGLPVHFIDRVAEHLGHSRVREEGPVLGIDDPDALLGQFDDLAIFLFADPQGCLG